MIKLEVGKTYIDRQCAEIKIVEYHGGCDLPFEGLNADDERETFGEGGEFLFECGESPYDLVAERRPYDVSSRPVVPAPAALLSPLPAGSVERKEYPMWSGVLQYMPAALAAASRVSMIGNRKHNDGEPLHHARGKSPDHPDCMVRHHVDYDALRAAMSRGDTSVTSAQLEEELGCLMWRTGLFVQEQLEQLGLAPRAPRAVLPGEVAAAVLPKDGGLQK